MSAEHRHWIELLNAQETWTNDEGMLQLVPPADREFQSTPRWPRLKALAFLNNNAGVLRSGYARLEAGEELDLDLVNPVLAGVRLRLRDWRRTERWAETYRQHLERGGPPRALVVVPEREGWNRGTAHIRYIVHRAFYHFARYADRRLADPVYPDASPGLLRVLPCITCGALVACPGGRPRFCSEACSTDTGRLQ